MKRQTAPFNVRRSGLIIKNRHHLDVISLVGGTMSRPPAISWVALSSSWLTILKKRRSSRTFLQ